MLMKNGHCFASSRIDSNDFNSLKRLVCFLSQYIRKINKFWLVGIKLFQLLRHQTHADRELMLAPMH